MGSSFHKIIILVIIFTIAIPISMSKSDWDDDSPSKIASTNDSKIERYLKDLCSNTTDPKQSWKIIKPEIVRFTDTDIRNVTGVVIDLAIEKSRAIHDILYQLYAVCREIYELKPCKDKAKSCMKNYTYANHYLQIARSYLNFNFGEIPNYVDYVEGELKSCINDFRDKTLDSTGIMDRNKEFENYLEIVRAAANHSISRDSKA